MNTTGDGTRLRRGTDLVHAEWIKLWSVRSTWLMVAAAFVTAVGIGALAAHLDIDAWKTLNQTERAGVDPLADPLWAWSSPN